MGGPDSKHPVKRRWAKRVLSPLITVFRQGTDPSTMAQSVAYGAFLGILPLPGLNSVLCALIAVRRGLNMGVIQAVNWIMLPLQVALFLPMSRLGAFVLRHPPLPLRYEEVRALIKAGPRAFFSTVGLGFIDATLVWCVLGIPFCFLVFRCAKWALVRRAFRRSASAPAE